jgi:hypothetical protein
MFVSSDLIAYFIDFILEKQSPLSVYQKKYSLGTKSNPVNFSSGLNIILFFLKRVKLLLSSPLVLLAIITNFLQFHQITYSIYLIMLYHV